MSEIIHIKCAQKLALTNKTSRSMFLKLDGRNLKDSHGIGWNSTTLTIFLCICHSHKYLQTFVVSLDISSLGRCSNVRLFAIQQAHHYTQRTSLHLNCISNTYMLTSLRKCTPFSKSAIARSLSNSLDLQALTFLHHIIHSLHFKNWGSLVFVFM